MDLDRARDYARTNHHAVMATRTASGKVRQSPVLVGADDQGAFLVSSRETAYKTRHVADNGWAQLCILPDRFFGEWVYVEGTTEVVHLPEAMDLLVEYYRLVNGEHDDWEDYRAAMEKEKRVVLRMSAIHAGPDRQG